MEISSAKKFQMGFPLNSALTESKLMFSLSVSPPRSLVFFLSLLPRSLAGHSSSKGGRRRASRTGEARTGTSSVWFLPPEIWDGPTAPSSPRQRHTTHETPHDKEKVPEHREDYQGARGHAHRPRPLRGGRR